jgi:class 3 adenylate cyclase
VAAEPYPEIARDDGPVGRRAAAWATALALPLSLVVLLRVTPRIDERWEDTSAHFWLVFGAGAASAGLALAIVESARRRRDARLLLIGLAFLVSAGFLALHALATPGMLVDGKNAGFVLATPVGLIGSGVFAAASALELEHRTSLQVVRWSWALLALVLALMGLWAGISLAGLPPLRRPVAPSAVTTPLGVVAALGVLLYAFASIAYFRVWWRRSSRLAFAVAFAFALLAEALVVAVVSVPTSWRLSWWEWHALMAIGFGAIAAAASAEWREERFSGLYLDETLAGRREVTVLFADLAGFTPFSEAHDPAEVHAMLVGYFSELTPMIARDFGGEVHEFVGDQIFAIFNKGGDQPDHAVRAARAALALQRTAERVRAAHPEWPRFRVGVNSGPVLAGVVGGRGHRVHGVFGDTVNLGARLEGKAPVGGVLVGEATRALLPDGTDAEPVAGLEVKGKSGAQTAYVLRSVPA